MSLSDDIHDSKLAPVFQKVLERHGLDLNRYKIAFLKRRFNIRMRERGLSDYVEYAKLLEKDPQEFSELFQKLCINVTNFFRDSHVYSTFATHVLPVILSQVKTFDKIRVWSAGCATGEEPYSLAILFSHALNDNGRIEVIASDVNQEAIQFAKEGKYPANALRELPEELRIKYFRLLHDNKNNTTEYQVIEQVKNLVTFKVGDMLSNQDKYFDVIFCRNVLIYYAKETQEIIFTKFHKILKENGHLVIGMDETMLGKESQKLFTSIMPRERIYRKNNLKPKELGLKNLPKQ